MTRNQLSVLRWLRNYCSVASTIRVSNSEIAEVFGWSQPYAKRILSGLVENGSLQVLQKGTGHRPTKYLVSPSHNQTRASHNQMETSQKVQNSVQKRFTPFRYYNNPRNNTREGEYAYTDVRAHVQNVFDNVAVDVYKPVRTGNTPFKRFKQHCDMVEKWKGPDFVCYFSLVFRVRFGEAPRLDWKKDVGAARILRQRLGGDPLALKAFIQIAFAQCKRRPDGLHTFTYGKIYQNAKDSEITDDILDEYDDEYVFPWLKEKYRQERTAASVEYTKNLVLRSLGIYS